MLRLILAVAAALYIVVGAAGAFVARQEPAASAPPPTLESVQPEQAAVVDAGLPLRSGDEAMRTLDAGMVSGQSELSDRALTPATRTTDAIPDVAGRA